MLNSIQIIFVKEKIRFIHFLFVKFFLIFMHQVDLVDDTIHF